MENLNFYAKCNIVSTLYTGKLKITEENVEELLVTANYLLLGRLVDACCDFLRRQLDVHNCWEMYSFAEAHCCGELKRAAKRYILKNFGQISTSSSFLDASIAQLQTLLGMDNLNVPDERQVFDAIIRWVSHDPKARTDHLSDLLKSVRLPYLSETTLNAVLTEPLLASCPKCMNIVERARHCKTDYITYPPEWKSPRRSTNQAMVLVILGGVQSSQPGSRSRYCFMCVCCTISKFLNTTLYLCIFVHACTCMWKGMYIHVCGKEMSWYKNLNKLITDFN